MVLPVDALLVAGVLAGGVLCGIGYRVYRMPARLGRRALVAFAVLLGVGCIVAGITGLFPSVSPALSDQSTWAQVPLLFWLLSTLPWFVFALQYTGTRVVISRRTVTLLGMPHAFIFLTLLITVAGIDSAALNAVGTLVFIYIISLAAGGAYLLLQAAYSYPHFSFGQGLSLVAVSIGTLVFWNLISTPSDPSPLSMAGAYALGAGFAALSLGAAFYRFDLFESTPSIGTLGERALIRETDDLMLVVDDHDEVIKVNETAVSRLDVSRSTVLGSRLDDVIDYDTEQLRNAETVTMRTTDGRRRYDPQVSTVRDPHDNALGATLSFRDVTDRELREQRLAVLNRVLRHNLRNQVDVVKSHARAFDETGSNHADKVIEAADSIAALGQKAHKIDRYVTDSPEAVPVDLAQVLQSVLDVVSERDSGVSVTTDVPADPTLVTDERAVRNALDSAIDNAVTYADSAVSIVVRERSDGYLIRISDDGAGIPEWELDTLAAGTESQLQHTTGLGLWRLKWAVTTVNGDLSFDTTDGTTVEIFLPSL